MIHCNLSCVCLPTKMGSETVKRSIACGVDEQKQLMRDLFAVFSSSTTAEMTQRENHLFGHMV